jgi:TonB family protein
VRILTLFPPILLVLPAILLSAPQSELGKWWKNSEIVRQLQLTDTQIDQIEKSFLEHRHSLADAAARLQQQESQLNRLMQSDRVDEARAQAQIERVAAARAALEKANASLMLSIRKAISVDQWNRLREAKMIPMSAASAEVPFGAGAKEEPLPDGVYTAGGAVKAPRIVYQRLPSYTQAARDAKVEGIVLLEAIVRKDGSVDSIKVLKKLGYGLDESAMRTIGSEWKFEPGTLNGKPVDVKINVETSFRLY